MKGKEIKVILRVGVNIHDKSELKFWRERIRQEMEALIMRYKHRPIWIEKVK